MLIVNAEADEMKGNKEDIKELVENILVSYWGNICYTKNCFSLGHFSKREMYGSQHILLG